MTYSQIKITFTTEYLIGYRLNIYNSFVDSGINTTWTELFNGVRSSSNQVSVKGSPTAVVGERTAINFVNAFELDYNFPIQYEVSRLLNVVTIKSMIPDQQFISGELIYDGEEIEEALFEITNFAGTAFQISDFQFSQAFGSINKCSKIRMSIRTSEQAIKIISPIQVLSNEENPIVFEWIRGSNFTLIVENESGQQISYFVETPALLSKDNFAIDITYTPNGGTVAITKSNSFGLHVEYSLDNITFQTQQLFTGLEIGYYTLFVRDQYGCSFTVDLSVNEFNINNPYFKYSKSNSIRMAERVDFDVIPKNDENTLSCESVVKLPYKEIQRFNSSDNITLQFKSNLDVNTATIIPENPIVTLAKSNILLQSETLSDAVWTKEKLLFDVDKLIATNVFGFHRISQTIAKDPEAGDYTFSFFVKKVEYKRIRISISSPDSSLYVIVNFDAETGLFYAVLQNTFTLISTTQVDAGNGYFRVFVKAGLNDISSVVARIELMNLTNDLQYVGNNISGMRLNKFQFQKGDFTDYIQTLDTAESVEYSDGTFDFPVIKKTNNIGNKEKRDAVIYAYSAFKTGVYFQSGNVYDFNTNAVTGTYLLNGLLPIWAKVGTFISVDNIWYQIETIRYVEEKQADVLIINRVPPSVDTIAIAGSIYNTQEYEVYETTIVMGAFFNQNITLKIEASSDNFTNVTYLSEVMNIQEKHSDCLEIIYYNTDNNDVVYQTGIQHLLRLPFYKINGYFDDSSENNKTDSSVISLSATLYEGNEFIFEPVTKEIWRKLVIALSHKFVFIDQVGYVKDGEVEVEGPIEESNLYVVKAKMLKTGKVYSNISIGDVPLNTDIDIEIPGMVAWDGGFIQQ